MGLNNEFAERVVFDIETAPIDDAAQFLDDVEAPSNYKDEAKIAAYIADAKTKQLEKAALDLDLCRVVAIGWQIEGRENQAFTVEQNTEADILNMFWSYIGDRHLVGFNCLGFDLPVMVRRAQYLGLRVPSVQIDKYRHPGVTDLQMVLSFNGQKTFRSLSFYCKRFGISVPDVIDGAGIGAAVQEGRWSYVRGHVQADVQKTAHLAAKLGHFSLTAGGF